MNISKEISHSFAICAYKESPYLEECVISILNQTIKSNVIMCTSTPCDYIEQIATKYSIPLFIRNGISDIKEDWNFAYNNAKSDFVTLAHQDDVYDKFYTEEMYKKITCQHNYNDIILFLTDYLPLKSKTRTKRDINCKIRHLLRSPLKINYLAGKIWIKKAILAFGNSICCPTVTYHKNKLGPNIFTSEYKFNIDWDTFYKLAKEKGAFVYVDRPLVLYRVHDAATSKEFINNHLRVYEDTKMFRQFWPAWLVYVIMIFYKKAYDTYNS